MARRTPAIRRRRIFNTLIRMKKIFALFALLLAALPLRAAVESVSLDSDGRIAAWRLCPEAEVTDVGAMLAAGYDASAWVKAVVPGAVFTSYVEAGIEPDPNFGDNAYKVDRTKYDRNFWYRTELATDRLPAAGRQWICFEGVNRRAEVYFNGERLGDLDGFMDRGMFEVTRLLRRDGKANVLAVRVIAPTNPVANHASPTYISSAGWDWMPYVPGLLNGITDNVRFVTSGDVSLVDPWVRTKVPSKGEGIVSLSTELKNHASETVEGVVRGRIMPGDIRFEKPFKLEAGKQRSVSVTPEEFPQLRIAAPALWWPNGYGEQPLYTCELSCEIDGAISDRRTVTFGMREYSYAFVEGVFQLSVNGERIFCKGGNWGMSEWMLRCRDAEYDLKVRLHKEMHYNMIRNWIGSTTDEEFYEACDRYGILVFDDFWLNSHPNLPDDIHAFNRNAVEKIKRLRNHPSIAVWCGDNEGVPLAPLNEWLREDVRTFDGGDRWYQPISREYGFSGSGPWMNSHPIWYFTPYPEGYGDHRLEGWGFRTEIGSAVFTNYESYKKFMPDPERWPASPEMLDRHFFGNSAGNSRPQRYFSTVNYNYGESATAEAFCRKAQLLNLETNKAMYEGWQHRMWDDASGVLTWMSQSAYPSFVWQTYDYYYDLNGAYWGVRKACEPVHVQWSYADNTVKAVNATLQRLEGVTVEAKVYDMQGREVPHFARRATLTAEPNGAVKALRLDLPADRNLARGKRTWCSSSQDRQHDCGAVADGNNGTSWRSGGPGEQWVAIDLEKPTAFSDVVITWESEAAKAYRILVSDDAEQWRPVYENTTGSTPLDELKLDRVCARYVKIEGTAPHDDWQLVLFEVELYDPEEEPEELTPVHFIRLRMTDAGGNLLSENFYWRSNRPYDYRALNDLAPADLDLKTRTETVGDRRIVRATVTNKGRGVAFAVRVMPTYASTGEQLTPAIMDDNYFTLLPGEQRTVTVEFDEALLAGDRCRIVARPYNDR